MIRLLLAEAVDGAGVLDVRCARSCVNLRQTT